MARTIRTRTRLRSYTGTKAFTLNGTVVGTPTSSTINRTSSCTDFHGRPVIPGSFTSTQVSDILRLYGEFRESVPAGKPVNGIRYDGFPYPPIETGVITSQIGVPAGWYADTVARSNPSRPVVTPLTLAQDLIELPAMLRDVGRLLTRPKRVLSAKELANQHLAARFGWLPLVDDINRLLDVQSYTHRRVLEIKRLNTGQGLRRRFTLAEDHQAATYVERVTVSTGHYVDLVVDITVHRKAWATIRWRSSALQFDASSSVAMNRLARRVVLGFTPEGLAKGAWDIVPWSWLTSWFSNIGAFVLQYSNTVPAYHEQACLMNETTVTNSGATFRPVLVEVDGGWGGSYRYTSKTRSLSGSVTLGFNMPFLSMSRLSVLGSLFVQRFSR